MQSPASPTHRGVSPGIFTFTPGVGGVYTLAAADSTGTTLSGDSSYRLHLPANVPAERFWSLTASLYDNGQPFPAISSYQNLTQNADGSIDLTFAPTEPQVNAKNWTKTTPDKPYFVVLRFYGQPKLPSTEAGCPATLRK